MLEGDFLMSSKAMVSDTIMVIDITYPVPDSVEWVIPDAAETIEFSDDLIMLIFDTPGIYPIGYWGYLGLCKDYYEAEVEIYTEDSRLNDGIEQNIAQSILSVEVFPNPNNGLFTLKGDFSNKMNVILRIINLSLHTTVYEQEAIVEGEEKLAFDLAQHPPGIYAILIESEHQLKALRIIKN
jgi:hypothetical protein